MMRYAAHGHGCVCLGGEGRMGTCSGSCMGSSLWARARAARSRARAEVARANTRCSQDTSPLVLHAFGLHSAMPHSPRSPLRARVRGSCSGLGLGTRGSRSGSGSYSYSGLALDRTLGRCDRNNPVALRAFRIQPALGDRWPRALRLTRGRSPGRSSRCGGRPLTASPPP